MHKYSALATLRKRELDEKSAQNNINNFTSNYCTNIYPVLASMSPRETVPNDKPANRLSNSVSTMVPTLHEAVEVPHSHASVEVMPNVHSSGVEMTTGTRSQEEHSQLPGPTCRCEMKIGTLEKELLQARHQISMMSMQMEEQASHLHHLYEERFDLQTTYRPEMNFQLITPGGCNSGYGTYPQNQNRSEYFPEYSRNPRHKNRNQYCAQRTEPNPGKSHLVQGLNNSQYVPQINTHTPELVESLNQKVMALQMANIQLNMYLNKEEARRKSVEKDLNNERDYIKSLEDNIQNLKSSRIVMDPVTYKQVADNYIATKKRPVRRSHTCHPCIGQTDLVCDKAELPSQLYCPSVTSCPSSPLNAKISATVGQNDSEPKSHSWPKEEHLPMQREEYENLLSNLAEMDMSSRSSS